MDYLNLVLIVSCSENLHVVELKEGRNYISRLFERMGEAIPLTERQFHRADDMDYRDILYSSPVNCGVYHSFTIVNKSSF